MMHSRVNQKGFSLLEVAIAILILGIVLLGFQGLFKLVYDTDNIMEEKAYIQDIQKSLKTYLQVNLRLPCPDIDGDGKEDTVSGRCESDEGYLPYNDVGTRSKDAWDHSYFYTVNRNATDSGKVFDICESASVFGKSGPRTATGLYRCGILDPTANNNLSSLDNASNQYYCWSDSSPAATACLDGDVDTNGVNPAVDVYIPADLNTTVPVASPYDDEPDPRSFFSSYAEQKPPYFYFVTPPVGTSLGYGNLTLQDENGVVMDSGILALVISWGANGDNVHRYLSGDDACVGGTDNENANCDKGDNSFVYTQTGENRHYMTWITMHDAKNALVFQPKE